MKIPFFYGQLFFFFLLYAPTQFIGDNVNGFSFALFPQICVDSLAQKVYVGSNEMITGKGQGYSLSVYDIKNNAENTYKLFLPAITRNALVNGVLEANPIYGQGLSSCGLLLGVAYEPKYYPILSVQGIPQVFIINELTLYAQEKNKILATDLLTDFQQNDGQILSLVPLKNKFLVSVLQQNTVFGDGSDNTAIYTYKVGEKIIPLPGASDYITNLELATPTKISFSNELPSLLIGGENQISFLNNSFCMYGDQSLNICYTGISGQGSTGVAAVSLVDKPILPNQSAIDGNNIVATNQVNTPLYINQLSSLSTSSGLSYLLVLGGTNDSNTAANSIFALPVINDNSEASLVGTLANINQNPTVSFIEKAPYPYKNTVLNEPASEPGDLYNVDNLATITPALVGQGALSYSYEGGQFNFLINSIEGYKDAVFVSATYDTDNNGIGGIFYSQSLFNEYGMIKGWTPWQRKNMLGNIVTQTFIPTLGSPLAIYQNNPNKIFGINWQMQGPFLSEKSNGYENLPLAKSGIQKIIDIPYQHPGIGINTGAPFLKPSYLLAVGYNTVILQQTANNSGMLPLLQNSFVNCDNGTAAKINEKTNITNSIIFTGGALKNAGALFSGALGFSSQDCWLIVAGANGVYILADQLGNGCGQNFLQNNFTGISANLVWSQLGNFGAVKKVVANQNYLYVMTNKKVYRISLQPGNISLQKNCQYNELINVNSLPNSTEYSSFSDSLFSENIALLATSVGLFVNQPNSSIQTDTNFLWQKIELPEYEGAMPIYLSPVSFQGWQDGWGIGESNVISGNLYVMATSLSRHFSKIYRFAIYGNSNQYSESSIKLIPNYFIKNMPTYYYNPSMELLSIVSDGAVLLSHGVFSANNLYRSYLGLINPFLRHGGLALKNEFNFFEMASELNSCIGFPTYISGNGMWMSVGQKGITGLC